MDFLSQGFSQLSASHLVACLLELAQTEELLQSSRDTIKTYEVSIAALSDRVNSLFLLHSEAKQTFKSEKGQLEQVIEQLTNQLSSLIQPTEKRDDDAIAIATSTSEAAPEVVSRRSFAKTSVVLTMNFPLDVLLCCSPMRFFSPEG